MNDKLSRHDILRQLSRSHPNSHIGTQVGCFRGETPGELLGRYVVAAVLDLYGDGSSDVANRRRIAHELEVGSALLERVATRLRTS